MCRPILTLLLFLTFASAASSAQTEPAPSTTDESDASLRKTALILDLQALDVEATKIDKPIPRAAAKAEIADAAWTLDGEWARKLLREALELVLPAEEERKRLRQREIGADPSMPAALDMARGRVRQRVFDIARRDKAFADELTGVLAREVGRTQEMSMYATLGHRAAEAGDLSVAADYILRAIEAEPTWIDFVSSIREVGAHDRAAAERLTLQYIERVRALPVSLFIERPQALSRVTFGLRQTLRSDSLLDGLEHRGREIGAASRAAYKAYFNFVIDTLNAMEQLKPGSAWIFSHTEVSYEWPYVNRYAPELAGPLLALERATRPPGEEAPVPMTESWEETARKNYEEDLKLARKTKEAMDVERAANIALGRQDFAEARKLLDMLKDGATKTRLMEELNINEALSLVARGDTVGAERLARQLTSPAAILRVYPPVIRQMVKDKDASGSALLVNEAVLRLKRGETSSDQHYIPAELAPVIGPLMDRSSKVPRILSELAAAVAPAAPLLALEILEEAVEAANRSDIDTENGNLGFNTTIFTLLAERDDTRVRQAAQSLRDRLQRIAALAALYRRTAATLDNQSKSAHRLVN